MYPAPGHPPYGYAPPAPPPPRPRRWRHDGPPAVVLVAFWAVLAQIAVYAYRTWLVVGDPAIRTGRVQLQGVTFTGDSPETLVAMLWGAAGVGALLLFAFAAGMKNGGNVCRFLLALGSVITAATTAAHLPATTGVAHTLDLAVIVLAVVTVVGAYGPGSARWFRR